MEKSIKKGFIAVFTAIFAAILAILFCFNMDEKAFAVSADETRSQSFVLTDGCFDSYTNSDYFYNKDTKQEDESKEISKYPDYFSNGLNHGDYTIEDEWILGFVPEELFVYKGQYFYIGQQNGFFVDNDGTTQLVYLFDTNLNINGVADGYVDFKISPLFYHTYKYVSGKVYIDEFLNTHNLKIKDISFGAYIQNVNYANRENDNYVAKDDNGSFIISTNYSYKGSSLPEGYGKDSLNCALSLTSDVLEFIPGVGNVKDVFDLVVDSIDAVKTAWEISNKISEGYDVDLTNGDFVGTQFDTSKESQLAAGGLNRYAFTSFETSMDNPVLYLPNQGEGVTYRYCIGTTEHWKTRLSAGIALDIVEEYHGLNKSEIFNKYENIQSTWFTVDFWGDKEKPQDIETEKSAYIDMLSNTNKELAVTVPYASEYEILIPNAEFAVYDSSKTGLKVLANNQTTIDLEDGELIIIKLRTLESELHTSVIINCKPKILNIDDFASFTLKPYAFKLYRFEAAKTQAVWFNTNNNNLGIRLYDARGELIGDYNSKNINYLCASGEMLYIQIYNNSNTVVHDGSLSLAKTNSINSNKKINIEINGLDTIYLPLDIFAQGKYIVDELPTSIVYRFLNSNKGEETFITNNCYLELTNLSAAQQSLSFIVEFSPVTVVFGDDTYVGADEYVKFVTQTDEVYKLSNNVQVYDYNFDLVEIYDGSVYLQANNIDNKYYYINCKSISTLNINVSNADLFLETEQTVVTDKYGYYYFKFDVTLDSEYIINSPARIYIYDENLCNPITVESGTDFGLLMGKWYIKLVTESSNTSVKCLIKLSGGELDIENQNVLHNTGVTIFKFMPKYTEEYKFFTLGDLNNTLTTQINIYILQEGRLALFAKSDIDKYVELTKELSSGTIYYISVELKNALDEAVVFTVEYNNGGHEHEIVDTINLKGNITKYLSINVEDAVVVKYTPQQSGNYIFYVLNKSITSTFSMCLYNEIGAEGQKITGTSYDGSTGIKYSINLEAGQAYYFVLTYNNGSNANNIQIKIGKQYIDIVLKASLVNGNTYNSGSPLNVIPGMEYKFALYGDDIAIIDNYNYTVKGDRKIFTFDYYTKQLIIHGTEAIGKTIAVSVEYLEEYYTLVLLVKDPFASDTINIGLSADQGGYVSPQIKFSSTLESTIIWSDISPKITYQFYRNGSQVVQYSNIALSLSNKTFHDNRNFLNDIEAEFDTIKYTISYTINGYTYKSTEKEILCNNTKLNIQNYSASQSNGRSILYLIGDTTYKNYNKTIAIPSNIKVLTLVGTNGADYYGLRFNIENRTEPLLIYIKDFQYYAPNDSTAIKSYSNVPLYLYCKGTVCIQGGTGSSGTHASYYNSYTGNGINGGDGKDGAVAIDAYSVYVYGYSSSIVTIHGGNGGFGGDGYYGRDGANGANGTNATTFNAACGKSGGNGGNGGTGGNGGNGACAIMAKSTVTIKGSSTGYIYIYAGYGGDGGNGGDGGAGGRGGNGADTANRNSGESKDGGNGGTGGKGGNGGRGGDGGDGAAAISASSITNKGYKLYVYASYGGSSGSAGYGGKGGDGGTGGADTRIFGSEGKGGNGGNGGNGADAGTNGTDGSKISISGNSSNQYVQRYQYTLGGYYSYGGKGGTGGSAGSAGGYNANKSNGKDGQKGSDGTSGRRPQSSGTIS